MSTDRRRTPFNGLPIPQDLVTIAVPRSFLSNQEVTPRVPSKADENKRQLVALQEEMGYKRFVQCGSCGASAKIFTCFANSDRARCKAPDGAPINTHTHVDCECNKIVFAGLVQFVTKSETIPAKPVTSDTVTISKEDYEKFVALQQTQEVTE